MCVQCVMGAAVGFGVFQTYRFVIKDRAVVVKDRARKVLASREQPHEPRDEASNVSDPDLQMAPTT
jgi:hypothetical protein